MSKSSDLFPGLFLIALVGMCLLGWTWFSRGSGGNLSDGEIVKVPLCRIIYSKTPFILPIRNLTLCQGSAARIHCRIVKPEILPYENIFWTGPNFEGAEQIGVSAEDSFTKIIRAQKGVQLAGNRSWENLDCPFARINPVDICTLLIDPIAKEHEGWYTCSANFTATKYGANFMWASEEKFYFSVI